MRRVYYPESIRDWELNLLQQGGSLVAYAGLPYQRGHGIGSFFRGIFRAIWPTVKKVGIAAGKEALQAGSEATRDHLTDGVDFKTALKNRGKQALGRSVAKLGQALQGGRGLGRRVVKKAIKGLKRNRKINKKKKDIFSNGKTSR